jgi:hypothetical protein
MRGPGTPCRVPEALTHAAPQRLAAPDRARQRSHLFSHRDVHSRQCRPVVHPLAVEPLAVIATKVVHPGKPGQAVGCHTHRLDRRISGMNVHKNARLDAARSIVVGGTHHRAGLDGDPGGAGRRPVHQHHWLARAIAAAVRPRWSTAARRHCAAGSALRLSGAVTSSGCKIAIGLRSTRMRLVDRAAKLHAASDRRSPAAVSLGRRSRCWWQSETRPSRSIPTRASLHHFWDTEWVVRLGVRLKAADERR